MTRKPRTVFPCDCMSEGLMVTTFPIDEDEYGSVDEGVLSAARDVVDEDEYNYYGIQIGFWRFGSSSNALGWKDRLRWCWRILRTGRPYYDQVMLNTDVAKNFANHILYQLSLMKRKVQMKKYELSLKEDC